MDRPKDYLKQNILLQEKKSLQNLEEETLLLRPAQKRYFLGYFLSQKNKIFTFLGLLFGQTLLDTGLLLVFRSHSLKEATFAGGKPVFLFLAILFLIVYITVVYFSTRLSQSLVIELTVRLRRKWFLALLSANPPQERARIFAKIAYYLPLLQTNLLNLLLNAPFLIFSFLWLLGIFLFTKPGFLPVIVVSILICVTLTFLGNKIGKKYISREQTFSSQVLRHLAETVYDRDFISLYRQQKAYQDKLDNLSGLDMEFRIRRNLWYQLSPTVLFAIATLAGFAFYSLNFSFSQFLSVGAVMTILTRNMYKSLSLGLSLYPLKLGACLSVPIKKSSRVYPEKTPFSAIVLEARKVKLGVPGKYFKKLDFVFEKGEKYCVYADSPETSRVLGRIFSASTGIFAKPWTVRCDGKWLPYQVWRSQNPALSYINSQANMEKSFLEIISGKPSYALSAAAINDTVNLVKSYPELDFIYRYPHGLATSYNDPQLGFEERGLLQLGEVIKNKPSMVIIDLFYSSAKFPKFASLLKKILLQNPNLILVVLGLETGNFSGGWTKDFGPMKDFIVS